MATNYLENLLGENEQILFETHQHWFVLFGRIFLELVLIAVIIGGSIIASGFQPLAIYGLILILVPLVGILNDILVWRNKAYIVTNRRVIQVSGVLNKDMVDSSLEKINDVKMSQPFFGRVFGYGDIQILTASEMGVDLLHQIAYPIEFKTAMLNAKEKMGYRRIRPGSSARQQRYPDPDRKTGRPAQEGHPLGDGIPAKKGGTAGKNVDPRGKRIGGMVESIPTFERSNVSTFIISVILPHATTIVHALSSYSICNACQVLHFLGKRDILLKASMTDHIRNFCIIAHIDHGKSTLADRLLQLTGAISERDMTEQVLDTMDLEREKGVTIKASAVRMYYTAKDNQKYEINLIDTPGHVDFGYEVSRALKACEGAVLVVDASQGIEAQTLANLYQALDADLTIIPVINKIDLPSARPDEVAEDVGALLGIDPLDVIQISAKEGINVEQILEAIVMRVPPPRDADDVPLRALIFDSHYDAYKGVIAYVRVVEGSFKSNDILRMFATKVDMRPVEIGIFAPGMKPVQALGSGEVGYIATGFKTVHECRVGDTITRASAPASEPLPGYRTPKPMVFAGIYPVEADDYSDLREGLDKLQLNDASLTFQPETSQALGFGFRAGFLGLFHMEIIQERIEREYDLNVLFTAPSVEYEVLDDRRNGHPC
jgi:small GTP-binding protein